MRKNFFKKLSFVLALAMIVSVIAPAAGVFAATGLKLNSTNKTLHLAQPGKKNKFNFNIDGTKQKGWKYLWTSSNEDVAEVNEKNGVTTAVGVGTAEITVVITDKNGAEVDRLTAKVTVKDNIKTVAIKNAPTEPIPVGEEYDFNRSFVTYSGSTTKTTAVTRWSVEGDNKDKAAINDENGKFTATEAGKYTVVARSFQSKAKYNEWKESGDASLVLDEASAEVTVKPSIKEVKQFDLSKFTVTFDSDMKNAGLKADVAKVYKVINGKEYESGAEKIKNITLDETGKVATVEMFTDFAQEADYRFKFDDLSGDFKTAKVALENVASIEFSDMNVNVSGKETKLVDFVIGKNADGVIIYRGQGDPGKASADQQQFNSALSFELTSDADLSKTFLDTGSNYLYIYEKGYTVGVKVKFEHYYYNEETKNVETITWTDNAVATGVETDGVLVNSSMQFAVSTYLPQATDGKWGVGPFKLAADDTGYKIYARYKTLDKPNSWDPYQPGEGKFVYESTNTDKLIIQKVGEDSYLYPIAAGSVTVLVRDGDVWNKPVVGAFDIAISEARTIGSVTVENSMVTLNNNLTHGTEGEVTKIVVLDSLNEAADSGKIGVTKITRISSPKNSKELDERISTTVLGLEDDWWNIGKIAIEVNAKDVTETGNYQYKFTVFYKYSSVTRDVVVNFNVKDGKVNTTVQRWALELDESDFDLKDVKKAQSLGIKVYGYNSNNVVVDKLGYDEYELVIEKNNVPTPDRFVDEAGEKFNFVKAPTVSGSYLDIAEVGTYVITVKANDKGASKVKKAEGAIIGRLTFTLKDSTERTFDFNPVVVAGKEITVEEMVKAAFDFYLNGNKIDDDYIIKVKFVSGKVVDPKTGAVEIDDWSEKVDVGQSILIKEVYVEGNDGNVLHKYTINRTVTVK